MIEKYVLIINKLLVAPKKELEKKKEKKNNKRIENLVKKYDKTLLDKYRYIEKMIDEELLNDE